MRGNDSGPSGFGREGCLALGLVVVLVAELGLFFGLHRGTAELRRAFEEGRPEERIAALHVLVRRDRPLLLDERAVAGLLVSADAKVAEFLMVEGVVAESQTGARQLLAVYADEGPADTHLKTRCRFLLRKNKGLEPIREYLRACRADAHHK